MTSSPEKVELKLGFMNVWKSLSCLSLTSGRHRELQVPHSWSIRWKGLLRRGKQVFRIQTFPAYHPPHAIKFNSLGTTRTGWCLHFPHSTSLLFKGCWNLHYLPQCFTFPCIHAALMWFFCTFPLSNTTRLANRMKQKWCFCSVCVDSRPSQFLLTLFYFWDHHEQNILGQVTALRRRKKDV